MRYFALIPILLAGCATAPAWQPTGPCRVDDAVLRSFVGTRFRMAHREEMQARTNAPISRILRRGDSATMDFRPDRLNILLDENRRVNGLRCG